MGPKIRSPEVASRFAAYPPRIRTKLMALRRLIFETAAKTRGVGELEETLKWGEPAYLTSATDSGTTLRIDWKPKKPEQYAMYFNCQTTLAEQFRTLFPELELEGTRAIIFRVDQAPNEATLKRCIAAALTYHQK